MDYETLLRFARNHNGVVYAQMIKNHNEFENKKTQNKPKTIKKKKYIPKKVKIEAWNKYIGEEKGIGECQCCQITKISQSNFHCGHIISEKNGGKTNLANLKPICAQCNLSMGSTNMDEFIKYFTQ